jgi:hypothetical protein
LNEAIPRRATRHGPSRPAEAPLARSNGSRELAKMWRQLAVRLYRLVAVAFPRNRLSLKGLRGVNGGRSWTPVHILSNYGSQFDVVVPMCGEIIADRARHKLLTAGPAQHPGSDAARLGPRSEAPMVHSRVYAEAIALGAIILISTTVALSQTIVERFPGPGKPAFHPGENRPPSSCQRFGGGYQAAVSHGNDIEDERPPFPPGHRFGASDNNRTRIPMNENSEAISSGMRHEIAAGAPKSGVPDFGKS